MSYSVSTYVTIDDEQYLCQDAGNMTWNVNGMYYKALKEAGIEISSIGREWDMKPVMEVLPHIETIIAGMEAKPDEYKALNPDNGWGDYEGALQWVKGIRKAILLSPESAIFCIS